MKYVWLVIIAVTFVACAQTEDSKALSMLSKIEELYERGA